MEVRCVASVEGGPSMLADGDMRETKGWLEGDAGDGRRYVGASARWWEWVMVR